MPRETRGSKLQLSDSEKSPFGKPPQKRQKLAADKTVIVIDDDVLMADATVPLVYDPDKNSGLKGRKRFNADLTDIQEACKAGLSFDGLKVIKARAGDDEGSVEVVIAKDTSEHVLAANLLISDTSEYPKSHSLFCYSPDGDLSSRLQKVVDEVAEASPKPLGRTIKDLVGSVAKVNGAPVSKFRAPARGDDTEEEDMEEDDDAEDYDAYADYDDIGAAPVEPESLMAILQENFVEIVATEYRPGFIRQGGNDFVISISLPVVDLTNLIPPRALMAWDRRLLSCSQHLTLLISGFHGLYPVLENDGSYTSVAQRLGVSLTFKVGLSEKYKPGREQVQEVVRKHGLIVTDAEDELRKQEELAAQHAAMSYDWEADAEEDYVQAPVQIEEEEVSDPWRFERFSLSNSLESLMDQSFLKLVQLRRKFGLGWAGAEHLHAEIERSQMKEEDVLATHLKAISAADQAERSNDTLPHDPLHGLNDSQLFNLPLTAFCYLIRRLASCTRFCIVCHNQLQSDYEALKPYVCDSKLCAYQYYSLNRGPSLEYEIMHNPQTVDLLVSLAYVAAVESSMDDPLPVGMGLRVPPLNSSESGPPPPVAHAYLPLMQVPEPVEVLKDLVPGPDGLVDFDDMTHHQMRISISKLLNTLPSILDMKKHLEQKVKAGKRKPVLKELDANVIPAAWSLLRWCVASCTAHIEAIESQDELIKNLDPSWRQFRMSVGAPAAEAKFRDAVVKAQEQSKNAVTYPVIYAFHGSPLKNWHSIIRHGLWYKSVAHGRAFGDGVYLAKDAQTSMGYYSQSGRSSWHKTTTGPTNCMALAEIVNLPASFVSTNPHYVVKDTHWIMCRYLLVKGIVDPNAGIVPSTPSIPEADAKPTKKSKKSKEARTPYVNLDPQHKTQVSGKVIEIPDPNFQIENLLAARKMDFVHEDADEEDMSIFHLDTTKKTIKSSQAGHFDLDDDDDYNIPASSSSKPQSSVKPTRPKDDWKHDAEYVQKTSDSLMLPPFESSPGASMAIQRELKAMIKEQDAAPCFRDLGWYVPPDLLGDNLYQWIVELHSFDPTLPIAKDLKTKKVNSIIFEIRFPPTFPNSPPFFRIVTPRFLPFIQGGGGHVTGGGSICMDLLTTDGWLPSYSISAVLMQIRLALSNLEPRPARLAQNWNQPYGVAESLVGFKRAAATHNWTVPTGLDRLVR